MISCRDPLFRLRQHPRPGAAVVRGIILLVDDEVHDRWEGGR